MTQPDNKLTVAESIALQRATGEALLAALAANALSFTEVPVAARLVATVRQGGVLSTDDARKAWRILARNEGRLAAAGIALPGGRTAAPAPVQASVPAPTNRPTLSLRTDGRIGVGGHPFALKDALRVEAHAVWDTIGSAKWSTTGKQQWHTPATPACAAALVAVLGAYDPAMSAGVARLVAEFAARAERQVVLDPEAPVPGFDASPLVYGSLWEHQRRAVEYATHTSASLLAMPMGSGKTAAAIATANRTDTARAVIVCPNKVRGVWPREVEKWSRSPWHMVDGKRPARTRNGRPQDLTMAQRLEQAEECLFDCGCGASVHAAVFNYEMLSLAPMAYRSPKDPGWVPPVMLDLVIYDEIHRLKSPTGAVSKTAAHWVDLFRRRIGLTGTPMPQYPWDIFGVHRALDPGIFGTVWTPFKTQYVKEAVRKDDGKAFPVSIHKEQVAEFTRRVHSIMYRPTVDLKLPGAAHVIRPVELEPKAATAYRVLDEDCVVDLVEFTRSVADRPDADDAPLLTPKNVLSRTLRLRQFTGGTIPDDGQVEESATGKLKVIRDRYRVSRAKADELEQVLDEIGCVAKRDGGAEPVVVYCAFRDDLDAVAEVAEKLGLRYGEISGRRSDGLSDRSELAAHIDLCGVQVASGGTGIDLTRSCYGVWYSPEYSAGDYDQALKRQDRPGQTRVVHFVHLVARGTVDEDVYRSLATRKSMVATFLAARGVALKSVGLSEDDAADPTLSLDAVQKMFNDRRAAEGLPGDDARAGGARLPLDEFAADVFGEPVPRGKPAPRVDLDKLTEFGLEGFL